MRTGSLPQGSLSVLWRACLGPQQGLLTSNPRQQLSALCRLGAASCPLLELQHLGAVLLQGAHVTINARAEEDVEPECIMQKVARASGANYAFHKESGRFQDIGPQAPVVSAAQGQACLIPQGLPVLEADLGADGEPRPERSRSCLLVGRC